MRVTLKNIKLIWSLLYFIFINFKTCDRCYKPFFEEILTKNWKNPTIVYPLSELLFQSFSFFLHQVVSYLKENLSDKNVLLVLQHICLYCSGSAENNFDDGTLWNVPVTEPPRSKKKNDSDKDCFTPSAPPPDQVMSYVDNFVYTLPQRILLTYFVRGSKIKKNIIWCSCLSLNCEQETKSSRLGLAQYFKMKIFSVIL